MIRRLVYNSTPTGTPLPATLTATGAFTDLATLAPAAGIVAYEPNVAYWSDYAKKRRWFSVPALTDKITFTADGNWTYPAGTVWVKHFDLELTRGDPSSTRQREGNAERRDTRRELRGETLAKTERAASTRRQ